MSKYYKLKLNQIQTRRVKFRTEINFQKIDCNINHQSGVVMLGSCFSDSIGNKLKTHGFRVVSNPMGTLFHPLPIHRLIDFSLNGVEEAVVANSIIKKEEAWVCFFSHSKINATSKKKLIQLFYKQLEALKNELVTAEVIFITYGTAFGYFHNRIGYCVANCHKAPQAVFEKRLFEAEELLDDAMRVLPLLNSLPQKPKVIFTLSPVRHLKDGMLQNQLSKAILRLTIEKLQNLVPHWHYFPAYEIMMDDLRDYRFYNGDLLHPNEMAVDYIWEKFKTVFFDEKTSKIASEFNDLWKLSKHQTMTGKKAKNKNLDKLNHQIKTFEERYPHLQKLSDIG